MNLALAILIFDAVAVAYSCGARRVARTVALARFEAAFRLIDAADAMRFRLQDADYLRLVRVAQEVAFPCS